MVNAGQDVYFQPDSNGPSVYFSDGPLSYRYRLHGGVIKFGSTSQVGSEHQIDGKTFPGEVEPLFSSGLLCPCCEGNYGGPLNRPVPWSEIGISRGFEAIQIKLLVEKSSLRNVVSHS